MADSGDDHSYEAIRRQLGLAMKAARETAGLKTRQVPTGRGERPHYSSGHVSLVETGKTMPSLDMVEQYVRFSGAADLLALHRRTAAAGVAALRSRRTPGQIPPRDVVEVFERTDVQRHYVVVVNEATYRFAENGAITDVSVTVTLRARTPGVWLYYTGFKYEADPRPGVLRVEPADGAVLVAADESDTGTLACYLKLDTPLGPEDGPRTIRFVLHCNSTVPALPRLRFHASDGNETLILNVEFAPGAAPDTVTRFAAPDAIDAEHPRRQSLMWPEDGRCTHQFNQLVPGWVYGFRWNW